LTGADFSTNTIWEKMVCNIKEVNMQTYTS